MSERFVTWMMAISFFLLICAAAAYGQGPESRALVGQFAVLEQEAPQQKKWRIEGGAGYIPPHLITRQFHHNDAAAQPPARPEAIGKPETVAGAAAPLRPMIPALD